MPYLMDDIAYWGHQTLREREANHPILGVYPDMMRRINTAPRYLLDEKAIDAAVAITLGRPKVLFEAMAYVRVPYESLWIEWPESGRQRLRDAFGGTLEAPGRPIPKRLGFLIEAENGGRKGIATWVWDAPDGNVNIAPISPHFDLDRNDAPQPFDRSKYPISDSLGKLWAKQPAQLDALQAIWRTAEHLPNSWGEKYLRALQRGSVGDMRINDNMSFRERVDHLMADVLGEYIVIWSIMLLLTSSRKVVEYREVDRGKLNKARQKRRETPLLDHTEVVLRVGEHVVNGVPRGPLEHPRKSPRRHLVAGSLRRRGDKYWYVQSYIRGEGAWLHRNIHVRG